MKSRFFVVALACFTFSPVLAIAAAPDEPVSYYRQIRPIFQANCHGCHQPAKAGGKYVMTALDKLLAGGESGEKAVVPGQPEHSYLLEQITPEAGRAEMPKDKPALNAHQLSLVRRWIAEGAKDDTARFARKTFDAAHPPVYPRPPVIDSLDFSPDGKLLAVSGYYEVLLLDPATGKLLKRLVGKSPRVETVRFSPDGKRLLAVGGRPSEMGEVQIWDVAAGKQLLSKEVTYNTLYGGSWSPDGKLVAFGCGDIDDNTVRAINATTGEQVLFQGAHNDWVRDTAFSTDGSHVVSVGRDMTVKLTEVATQRFIDNVTSITPGALKGGIQALARHPKLDHVVAGGADGTPKVYRLYRESKRVIGDDANLVFDLLPLAGRVFSVRFSADGKRVAAGSSLDGSGEIVVCTYDYATDVPQNIKDIMAKVPRTRPAGDVAALEEFKKKGVKPLARVKLEHSPIYAVAFDPTGKLVAAAGADGQVRMIDAETGKLVREYSAAPISPQKTAASAATQPLRRPTEPVSTEALPKGAKVAALEVEPREIVLNGRVDYAQLLVTARLASGETADATRLVTRDMSQPLVQVSPSGLVQPLADGKGELKLSLDGKTIVVPVKVENLKAAPAVDFVHDVAPVLSKLGCNQGTCHGAAQGKNGFKLSLRGYDPLFDVRALTDDLASRRVNLVAPDDSLMLLKASAGVPHMGGQLTRPGDAYYEVLRNWILAGAKLDTSSAKVAKIAVSPQNPVVPRIGGRQQIRVLATYADGSTRDVTHEAFIESGNTDVATASRGGLMTAARRGEAPVLARYEGAYAATTLTVMGDRTGFAWKQPETWGPIDELVAGKWQRMKIQPSELAGDTEFLRRVYLDLTGLPPTADQVREFLADKRPTRAKRDGLIDKLVGNPAYVEYWTNKWADLLQVNRKFLGPEGAVAFRAWIREQVAKNTPYDQFVRSILTAAGSNHEQPAASYYKILRDPAPTMENTTHLFMAVRFNCNKCHDHPFERWTQDQYYQTAAYFAQVGLKTDPASAGKTIGGTAVEGAKPLYEVVYDAPSGDITHERTGQVTAPKFPFACKFTAKDKATRREQLANWITSPDNQYFARSYVNRLWGYLFGVGIMEPIDDIRAGNPPSNPELLEYLTRELISSGFNVQHVVKLIVKSRTYQLSYVTNRWNADDKINYSHAIARRLPAEVLYDTVYRACGATSKIPGVKPGTRAAELPDSGVELPSGFLATFGRPARESACECERSSGLQLGPVMALISGPTISEAIADPTNELAKLVAKEKDDRKLVNEIFLRIMNRPATDKEIDDALSAMRLIDSDHAQLIKALAERETYAAPIHAKQEKERQVGMAAAQKELDAYEKELAPKLAEQEKKKAAGTAKLEAELKAFEATLPKLQQAWEAKQAASVEWIPLRPNTVRSSGETKLTVLPDRSVFATGGKPGRESYLFDVTTDLRGITGIRIEALADPRLPQGGPGRAGGGNFVLNEFKVSAVSTKDAKQSRELRFQRPQADFSQDNFAIAFAIDGNPNPNRGWAISPAGGSSHWAVLELAEPVGFEGGTRLMVRMNFNFRQPNFTLGRFRISVAIAKPLLKLGLSEDLQAAVSVPAKDRSPADQKLLADYYRGIDPTLRKHQTAVAESRKPLPIDPKLKELREKLELVSRPVPLDSRLLQLRQDVKISAEQVKNERLTGAQDLAWALINSPAFLFNH